MLWQYFALALGFLFITKVVKDRYNEAKIQNLVFVFMGFFLTGKSDTKY